MRALYILLVVVRVLYARLCRAASVNISQKVHILMIKKKKIRLRSNDRNKSAFSAEKQSPVLSIYVLHRPQSRALCAQIMRRHCLEVKS